MEVIQRIDNEILLFIQNFLRFDWLNDPMILYTELGDVGLIWIIMSIAMLCFKKTRKVGILALLAMGVGVLLTNVMIKPLISRPRPYLVVEGLLPLMSPPEPNSFPSGHTTAAFAMLYIGEKALPYKWMKPVLFWLAILMAFSRLYVGVHFFTDVLAGSIIGTFSGFIVWNVYKIVKKQLKKREKIKVADENKERIEYESEEK